MNAKRYGTMNPNLQAARLAGNANNDGVLGARVGKSFSHPGKITVGPGRNRPRIHLVSSPFKVPANVYAEAVAARQARTQAAVNKLITTRSAEDNAKYDRNAGIGRDGTVHASRVTGAKPHFKQVRQPGGVDGKSVGRNGSGAGKYT